MSQTSKRRYLLGIAWPYANSDMHIGHFAGVYCPADIFARFQRMRGNEVLMVSGSDAHGTPITVSADKEGISPREVVNKYHDRFLTGFEKMKITFDLFTVTMSTHHESVVHEMFKKHQENGYLYREKQKQIFDPKVQKFLPDRYVEGTCPFCNFPEARGDQCDNCGKTYEASELKNPRSKMSGSTELEVRESEHFVFDLAKSNDFLCAWLGDGKKSHWRSHVLNFSKAMVEKRDLHGRTITRDLEWGVTVPVAGFETKRLYVWYEAVMGYYSAAKEHAKLFGSNWESFWKDSACRSYYFLGKDNITFHSVLWPAFLNAYGGLNLPYDVPASEYLNSKGRKLSKSRGNSIRILDVAEKYQVDAWRYVLTALAPETADSDFTWDDFVERVNSELVANWGNLVNRVLGFASKRYDNKIPQHGPLGDVEKTLLHEMREGFARVESLYDAVKLRAASEEIRSLSQKVNQYLSDKAPWTLIKTDAEGAATAVFVALQCIEWLNVMWSPILVESCEQIHTMLGWSGKLFGEQKRQKVRDAKGEYEVLTYDHATAQSAWKLRDIVVGQAFGPITAPFQKLDPKLLDEIPND